MKSSKRCEQIVLRNAFGHSPGTRKGGQRRHRQQGVALVMGLILLVVVTLLGVSNLQTVALEERMTAATFDRQLALQAAEAALRFAEGWVEENKPNPSYTDADATCHTGGVSDAINNCNGGVCPPPDKDCPSRWLVGNFTGWVNATLSLPELAGTPQFFIEYLGNTFPCADGGPSDPKNCKHYRITARSNPGEGRAAVMLQSIYRTN